MRNKVMALATVTALSATLGGCANDDFRTFQSAFTHDSVCNTRVGNEGMARAGGVLDRHDRRLAVVEDFGFSDYQRLAIDDGEHCQASMWFEASIENLPEVLIQHLQAVNDQTRRQVVDSSMVQDLIRQSQDAPDASKTVRITTHNRYIQTRHKGIGERVHEVTLSEPLYWTISKKLRQ